MSNEIRIPRGFSEDAAGDADAHSPYVVVRQTDFHLKSFYGHSVIDRETLSNYINEFTLPFLDQAANALPMVSHLSRDLGTEDYPVVRNFISQEGFPAEMEESVEALDYSGIIFGELPHRYSSPLYPFGFRNSNSFAPPQTIGKYKDRLDELRTVTERIAQGIVKKSKRPTFRPSLLRTEAFFEVGAKLPPPSEGEKGKFEIRDDFNQLLEGVEIDLP